MPVQKIDAPYFDELSVKALWDKMKTNEDFMRFMPDYLDDDLPEREFFFEYYRPSIQMKWPKWLKLPIKSETKSTKSLKTS